MLHLTSLNLKKDKVETLAIGECEDKRIHTDSAVNAILKKAKSRLNLQRCCELYCCVVSSYICVFWDQHSNVCVYLVSWSCR